MNNSQPFSFAFFVFMIKYTQMDSSKDSLAEIQKFFKKKADQRGFSDETPQDIILFLIEELGELAKAIRKKSGLKIDNQSRIPEIEDELADVFNYIIHLANQLNIDLAEIFYKKEEKNSKRKWGL